MGAQSGFNWVRMNRVDLSRRGAAADTVTLAAGIGMQAFVSGDILGGLSHADLIPMWPPFVLFSYLRFSPGRERFHHSLRASQASPREWVPPIRSGIRPRNSWCRPVISPLRHTSSLGTRDGQSGPVHGTNYNTIRFYHTSEPLPEGAPEAKQRNSRSGSSSDYGLDSITIMIRSQGGVFDTARG